jgi:hypothetical protein
MPDLRENAVSLLAKVSGINAKSVAATPLITVPVGKVMVVTEIVIRVTAWAAGAGAAATAGFGQPAAYTDYLAAAAQVIATGITNVWTNKAAVKTMLVGYAAGLVFGINVTVGSTATTETWEVSVFGYLI